MIDAIRSWSVRPRLTMNTIMLLNAVSVPCDDSASGRAAVSEAPRFGRALLFDEERSPGAFGNHLHLQPIAVSWNTALGRINAGLLAQHHRI
jgi:hypothetical protein